MKKNKISAQSTISEILKLKGSEKILEKYRFPCLVCPLAKLEIERLTLGEVCELYNINLEGLLSELNKTGIKKRKIIVKKNKKG